jgi:hypothetical protein
MASNGKSKRQLNSTYHRFNIEKAKRLLKQKPWLKNHLVRLDSLEKKEFERLSFLQCVELSNEIGGIDRYLPSMKEIIEDNHGHSFNSIKEMLENIKLEERKKKDVDRIDLMWC